MFSAVAVAGAGASAGASVVGAAASATGGAGAMTVSSAVIFSFQGGAGFGKKKMGEVCLPRHRPLLFLSEIAGLRVSYRRARARAPVAVAEALLETLETRTR